MQTGERVRRMAENEKGLTLGCGEGLGGVGWVDGHSSPPPHLLAETMALTKSQGPEGVIR